MLQNTSIKFPPNKQNIENVETSGSIVIVGANGAGKTRLSIRMLELNPEKEHCRIAAQKKLEIQDNLHFYDLEKSTDNLHYGFNHYSTKPTHAQIQANKWGNKPATTIQDDFQHLLTVLISDHANVSMNFMESCKKDAFFSSEKEIPETKLSHSLEIWNMVIQNKKLSVDNNKLIVAREGNNYPASEMSDGERVIFYFIGQCLCAKENSILIIDEPENHVHEAIRNQLWDEIEKKRQDCIFIYLTHDLEFAALRKNAKKICVRDYDGSSWDWLEVPETEPIPEEITLKILGSRRPVIFIEGENGSLDCKIYSCIYQSYTVIPRGSCRGVIDSTSTFRKLENLHHLKVFGIVDRDYRSDEEIKELEKKGIFVLSVAEIENILLTEGLIRQIIRDLREDNEDEIVDKIKNFIFDQLKKDKNNQAKEYVNHRLNLELKNKCFFSGDLPLENMGSSLIQFIRSLDIVTIGLTYSAKIDEILSERNYEDALKIFNKKNLFKQASPYFKTIKSYEDRIENFMKYKREEFIEAVKDFMPVLEDFSENCMREKQNN